MTNIFHPTVVLALVMICGCDRGAQQEDKGHATDTWVEEHVQKTLRSKRERGQYACRGTCWYNYQCNDVSCPRFPNATCTGKYCGRYNNGCEPTFEEDGVEVNCHARFNPIA